MNYAGDCTGLQFGYYFTLPIYHFNAMSLLGIKGIIGTTSSSVLHFRMLQFFIALPQLKL
jgi:hypothetical protein